MDIKGAMLFWKNAPCRIAAQKPALFDSKKNWKKFCFWTVESYVEKSEKNIGAKKLTLSIAVSPKFAIKVSNGVHCVYREKTKTLILEKRL